MRFIVVSCGSFSLLVFGFSVFGFGFGSVFFLSCFFSYFSSPYIVSVHDIFIELVPLTFCLLNRLAAWVLASLSIGILT